MEDAEESAQSVNTLRRGSRGGLVRSLQFWLANFEPIHVDGRFGPQTERIVQKVQAKFRLVDDGIVGPLTAGRFMVEGWLPSGFDKPRDPVSPYPEPPKNYRSLSVSQKMRKWGSPGRAPANATPGGPIIRDSSFSQKIVRLSLRDWFPHITGIKVVFLHNKVEKQWRAFFDDIVKLGLRDRIESCAGSWNPRYVRGSTTTFSSHAFATAIDFNAPQNWLGAQPAHKGEKGSLVEIIPVAAEYEIWWGGWFTRVDGMHFESTATDDQLELEWA